ncbi:hypothetical protein VTL71DRAFT_4758 [Oculimacula yallundae]|uniref:Uncharacterized protein n=1 Tax=Oculimacula yallundae TaxID=86028 RepID=A0ABR4C4M0_9HELO
MSIPTLAGLGSLNILKVDSLHIRILEHLFQPLTSVDLRKYTGRIRADLVPMLDINVLQVSGDLTSVGVQVLDDTIRRYGGMFRLVVYHVVTDSILLDQNITWDCLNTVNWSRFYRVSFYYPRMKALTYPKFFPLQPGSRLGSFYAAKVLLPSLQYPGMPKFELIWDRTFLTINRITDNTFEDICKNLRPSALHPRGCHTPGCACSITELDPVRVQTGITGPMINYLSPTPYMLALEPREVIALPAWESGCEKNGVDVFGVIVYV